MTTIGSEVQFGEFLRFSSSLDAASAWEVGAAGDIGTVIHDVKQETEADGCHDELSPWASDSGTALENYPSIIMPLKREKRTFSDILREVKVREDTLQCAVARLGGGAQGLQVLMEHVNYWASESQDEDVTATIRRGIVDLGMPPAPKRHCNPGISANSDDGIRNGGVPCFDASPVGPCETVNHGAAYTRALRKSHMVRQRGQTRVRRHPSMSKYGNRSRQWRISGSHEWSQDMGYEFSNENGKGYEFLFQKELRASDVSSLGRIVLPKKDAERHLPFLVAREGIMISLEDYHCGKLWTARYRFWPNNKSRMYLLENIGDFVNFHHLQEGDLLLCYRNEQGGYVIRGQKVPPNVKSPAEGLISKGAQVRENSPTRKMKSETTVMPFTHQFVDREGTHNANLADSSFDSLNCTLGEGDDEKYFQNGCSRQQDCFSQQSGYPTCGEDVLMSGFPASRSPPVHDCVFDPEVAMLSVNNVKNQFMDDNQFLE